MNKYIFSALLSLILAATAVAQTRYDAQRFSENNYYGTAKSISLGNAMTALGGDLGSIGINPAGSAVAPYSQFSITPNVSLSTAVCDYAPVAGGPITASSSDSKSRFTMPSIGATFNMTTGNDWGVKSMTFGFLANSTSNYLNSVYAEGINPHSSFMGSFAARAMQEGYTTSVLSDFNSYYDNNAYAPSWNSILAYRANLISGFGDEEKAYYAGGSENVVIGEDGVYYVDIAGELDQKYRRQEVGHKNDMVFNFALNVNDKFYAGINLGIPVISYSTVDYISESLIDVNDSQMGLINGNYHYSYTADAEGIYAKFGFIWKPFLGLRIGGAIQTPTLYDVKETWWLNGQSSYSDHFYDKEDGSPVADYRYSLKSPAIFNLGAVYTFGTLGLISVDWERTDYRGMSFSEYQDPYDGYYFSSNFVDVNNDISKNCYAQNALRIGAEFRPMSELSLRAGYNTKNTAKGYSVGMGYSSNGSFFFDVAARMTDYERKGYYPYADYLFNDDGTVFHSMGAFSSRRLFDFVFTFGWRF